MAQRAEIEAVREVLYDRKRLRELKTHLKSITILMQLDDDGPSWVIPSTGELTAAVREAADRCDKVAAILLETRERLAGVDFDPDDRTHMREAYEQLAKAWKKRAAVWRTPRAPDAEAQADAIVAFERSAVREFKSVREYFRGGEDGP